MVQKIDVGSVQLTLEQTPIERVERFKYLGNWLNSSMDPYIDIKSIIEQARAALLKLKSLISNPHFYLQLRSKFARCYSWSILLYGCETQTLKTQTKNRIEAFEMWTYTRLLKIPWTDINKMQKTGVPSTHNANINFFNLF